ncbi:MAG TPA: hypothetical protein VHD56_17945, partial [Tepidisphaeraceae bacterium]|nr:hypothetical protein [Tepidisphaeraceae bacterium]
MSRAVTARAARPATKGRPAPGKGYFQRSELPLASLIFLTPLLIIYEAGTRYFSSEIVAFTWMQGVFHLVGASGRHLPALAVVSILLACHIVRHDPWEVRPAHLFGMVLESVLLAIPLMLIGTVAAHYLPMFAANNRLVSLIVLSVGAGIYEELVFRLIAFT